MNLESDAAMEVLLLATKARAAVLWSHATPPSRALDELLRRTHHIHHSTSSLRHLAIGPSSFLVHLDQLHELLAHAHTADFVAVDRWLGSPRRVTSEERAELLAAFALLLERLDELANASRGWPAERILELEESELASFHRSGLAFLVCVHAILLTYPVAYAFLEPPGLAAENCLDELRVFRVVAPHLQTGRVACVSSFSCAQNLIDGEARIGTEWLASFERAFSEGSARQHFGAPSLAIESHTSGVVL